MRAPVGNLAAMIAHAVHSVRRHLLIASVVLGVAACGSQQVAHTPRATGQERVAQTQHRATAGERAAAVALNQVGVPYRYGGKSPAGFDCSGLVHYSYASAGVAIPRTTQGLWQALAPVDARQMRTGDLLFFDIQGKMSHVGMYLGGGHFVHAPSSGRVVTVERLDDAYYSQALIRAGRPQ